MPRTSELNRVNGICAAAVPARGGPEPRAAAGSACSPGATLLRPASYRLEDGTRDLLGQEISDRVGRGKLDSDADQAILAGIGSHALNQYLPGAILRGLQVFTASGRHALMISNLPWQELPPTPVNGFARETEVALINALHFGLIQILGLTPFAVDYENRGRLIRNVVPNPAASGIASSWGADSEFFWHTDNPHLPFGRGGADPRLYVPRYLTFYAMRNQERVPTELAAIEDAVARLGAEALDQLRSAAYRVAAPDSNDPDEAGGRRVLANTPVLELDGDGHHRVRYDRGTTNGQTDEAAATLDIWSKVLAEVPSREFVLETGGFLVFDNYRILHRRKAFIPGPPSVARWLRRCYAS
jgi:L-asparagine oxygenase